MKRIFGLLLLFVAFNVSAIEINSKLSGIWYNLPQDGHGLNVVILDENRTFIFWYVYHTDGTPMFLVTDAQNQGNKTTGTTYYNTGMKFGEFDPNDREQTVWGTSTVTFNSCNTATLEYSSNDPAYGSGSIPMQRLASVSGLKCSNSPLHGNYHGNWSEPGQVGYGFAALFENGDAVLYGVSSVSASVFLGQWWVTGSNHFAFDVTGYSVFGGVEHTSGTGNFNEEGLTATTTAGGELFATLMPSFQHSLSTADLAGNYDIHDWNNVVIGSVTIQSNGTVTGTTYSGCNINGTFSVPNANFNQAYIFAEISVCVATASGSGAAVYRNELNEIVIAAADGLYGYVWTLK